MFSQTTEYALRAVAWLALTPDALVPTSVLAEKTQVPPHYLAKVLQQLSTSKLVLGRRGVRGGYRLARPPGSITLLEVVRAVAQVERIKECPLGLSSHAGRLCPLHQRMDAAAKSLIEIYGSATLGDLVSGRSDIRPLCERDTSAKLTVSASR